MRSVRLGGKERAIDFRDTSRQHNQRCLIALAGPCGAGKTTVARTLAEKDANYIWIQEIEPPPAIRNSGSPTPEVAEEFQKAAITSRYQISLDDSASRIVILDRTLEEDREIFYPLYSRLGFLREEQVRRLTHLSLECEAFVGSPDCAIILTAQREVLKQRIIHSGRPAWLIESFDLQYALYADWIERSRGRFITIDVSEMDPTNVCRVIQGLIADLSDRGPQ